MIPGFKKRLQQEIYHSIENCDEYNSMDYIKKYIKIEKCIYPSNLLTWIGASMLACLNEEIDTFLITRKEYIEDNKKQLPDRFGH